MMKSIVSILILFGLANQAQASMSRNSSNQTVTDTATNLMWQDDSAAKTTTKTWEDAIKHCEDLTLGGHSDWRLPNINELVSIVDYDRYNPSIYSVFQNVSTDYYWSSSTHARHSSHAWYVDFNYGNSSYDYKANGFYVRCVRTADN